MRRDLAAGDQNARGPRLRRVRRLLGTQLGRRQRRCQRSVGRRRLTSGGTTWCWGRKSTYAYGDHGSGTPVEVPAFAGALAIALGDYSTCILKPDATGELGVPNPSVRDVLNRVVNLP